MLDSPARENEIKAVLGRKPALRAWYAEMYEHYAEVLPRCPSEGVALEIGSGAGFARERLSELTTSDVIAYAGVDRVIDAHRLPFSEGALRFIGMINVFHHIPDVEAFLREAERCLRPGGRVLIIDQHPGLIAAPIFKHGHHEDFDAQAPAWRFESSGPLSGANGALAWIVFQRDREKFEALFPHLQVVRYQTHSPLRYWLAGGLKSWSLLPGWAFGAATVLDRALLQVSPQFGSFSVIELERHTGGS